MPAEPRVEAGPELDAHMAPELNQPGIIAVVNSENAETPDANRSSTNHSPMPTSVRKRMPSNRIRRTA